MDYEQSWKVPAVPMVSVHICHLVECERDTYLTEWQEQGLLGPQSRKNRGLEAAEREWGRYGSESPEQGLAPR